MRTTTWRRATVADGPLAEGDHIGQIGNEREVRLLANRFRWSVEISGVVAQSRLIEPYQLDRASRKAGRPVDALAYSKRMAEAWAAKVLDQRDAGADDA